LLVKSQSVPFETQARKLVAARYSLIFVQTHEEERLVRILSELATKMFPKPIPLFSWTLTEGLKLSAMSPDPDAEAPAPDADTTDPLVALDAVVDYPRNAMFIFRDLHRQLDRPTLVRKMRDVHATMSDNYKSVFMSGAVFNIPVECQKEVAVLDLLLPGLEELDQLFSEVSALYPSIKVDLGRNREDLIRGGLGLTEVEARNAFTKLFLGTRTVGPEAIDQLYEEKQEIIRKEGILEYIPPRLVLDDIGGLDVLKEWLRQRRRFFSQEAESYGLDSPKGVLLTGISGCGKSLAVKAISTYWTMPMLRLDMNRIYAGIAGSPERSLEIALKTAEAVSPCVLWIDEIETAIVGTHGDEGVGRSTRIFSSFLTWMQEKTHVVFVAATANQIDMLPPELLRKGRFDEIFFVDLPGERERAEIFSVHLSRRKQDPSEFDITSLSKATPGFNGAEIEQVVLAALFSAFDKQRELTIQDLYRALGRMVPLSTTMYERIKQIKRWADTRAVKASSPDL